MKVAKWGNSLAVRLPAVVVEALDLKKGDDIEIAVAGARRFEIKKAPSPRELLARLRKYRGRLPADFKFDRLEAHARRNSRFDPLGLTSLPLYCPRIGSLICQVESKLLNTSCVRKFRSVTSRLVGRKLHSQKGFCLLPLEVLREIFLPGTVFAPPNSIAFHFTVRRRLPLIFEPLHRRLSGFRQSS